MLVLNHAEKPRSCRKMLNSQQEWYIQKNDRNINELYATLAILQKAMIF